MVAAGKLNPRTPLECKFSVPFCIALGLRGYRLVATDFTDAAMRDAAVTQLLPLIELEVVQNQAQYAAHMDVYLEDGAHLHEDTDIVLGHADNPMSAEDFRAKFEGLVEPVLGMANTAQLYTLLNCFDEPGTFPKVMALLDDSAHASA